MDSSSPAATSRRGELRRLATLVAGALLLLAGFAYARRNTLGGRTWCVGPAVLSLVNPFTTDPVVRARSRRHEQVHAMQARRDGCLALWMANWSAPRQLALEVEAKCAEFPVLYQLRGDSHTYARRRMARELLHYPRLRRLSLARVEAALEHRCPAPPGG